MKKVIDKFRIDAKHRVYTVRPLRRTFAAAVIFAAICLLSSFAAVPAYADNIASGTDWTFADDGTVTITSDAGMTDWVTWQQSNYEQRANVTAAVIGNAVTTVDAVAFYSCNNLASVTFEATSSVTAIGVLAFGYTALQTIEIPASVTSIGAAAFTTTPLTGGFAVATGNAIYSVSAGGALLETAGSDIILHTFPSGKTGSYTVESGITKISEDAFNSTNLTSVTIPAAITDIGTTAFGGSSILKAVTFEGDTPPMGLSANTFQYTDLTYILVPASAGVNYKTVLGTALESIVMEKGPDNVTVSSEAELKEALQKPYLTTITLTADVTLDESVTMNASHILTVPSGKTLTLSGGNNIITVGSNTLSINGGGTVTVANNVNGIRNGSGNTGVLNLDNITVNLQPVQNYGIYVNTVNVNSGATVNLNSQTGGSLIRLDGGGTLTVNTGGAVNIQNFYGSGINNSGGTVHINGGTVSVGPGTADNFGINNTFGGLLKYISGTFTGETGSAIHLGEGSKVEGVNGKFNDRGTDFTATGEVTVGGSDVPASENGLTNGMYFWNGSAFERLVNPVEITSIVLNITAPVAGATESTPTVGAGYTWSTYSYTTTSDGASFPIGSTFAANTDYTVTVVLFSLTGYQFGTIPTANVTGTNGVVQSATVNGGYLTVVVNYPAGFGTITGTMTVGGTIVSDLTQSAGGTGWMWTAPSATLILDNAYTGEPIAVNCQNYTDNIKLVYSGDVSVGSPSSSVIFCNGNLEISENGTGGVLTLTSTSANALHCAIEVNGSLAITGGMVNTEAAGSGTSPNAAVIYGKMGVSIDGSASVTANATGSDASGICVESGDITISTTGTLTANGNGAGGALAIRNGHKLNMSSGNLVLTGVPMYSEQFVDVIIGGGSSITIDGTAVYLAKLTLGGVSTETEVTEITSPASGYGVSSKFTDASGKLCFFLPAGNGLTVTLTAGGTTYSGTVTVATDHSTVATLNEFVPSPTYGVSIATFNNGRVTSAQANYMENDNVALTLSDITAGYELTSITVHKTGDGNTIVPLSGSGKSNGAIYTFGMPAYGVTVTATFDKIQVKRIELLLTGTLTLRIRNTGNVATGELSLALSGVNADAFTLPFATLGNLSVGDETDITLTPRADLTAGTYTATLTVSGAGLMSVSQEITYTVIPTGIESPQSKSLKVSIQNGILHLSGLTQGKPWSIYNISGIQVYQNIAKSDEEYITLPVRGAYIVKSGKDTIKVIY